MAWLPKVFCQDETKVNTIIKFENWKQRILIWKSIKKIYNYLPLNYKHTKQLKCFCLLPSVLSNVFSLVSIGYLYYMYCIDRDIQLVEWKQLFGQIVF